jgi:ABC-type glycerol-3-phosphate transport system substrate-binding protein
VEFGGIVLSKTGDAQMRSLQPLAVLVATAAIAGTLAGCTGSTASSAPASTGASAAPSQAAGEPVTVSFWTHTHPPMIEVYEKLIADYEAANPNVTIDYQTIPNNEFGTKMLTSLSGGTGPDIISMDDSALRGEYFPKGLLAPVDAAALGAASVEELTARYVPGTLAGAMDESGTLYGLPSEFNGTALAINAAHFEDAGLDPATTALETWDDLVVAGKALAAAGHPQAFSFLYLHSGWYSQQIQTLLHQTGGAIAEGTEGTLDSPEAQAALQLWVDLAGGSKSVGDPNVTSREATVPFQDLATGVQSMAILYPWSMDQIASTNPETYENLRVVPLPQFDPGDPSSRVYCYYWAVNRDSKVQPEAWKFVNFLSQHSADFLTGTDFVQPLVGWETSAAAQEIPFIETWGEAYATGKFDQVTEHYSEVQDVILNMVNSAVFDKAPVADATREAADEVSKILQN